MRKRHTYLGKPEITSTCNRDSEFFIPMELNREIFMYSKWEQQHGAEGAKLLKSSVNLLWSKVKSTKMPRVKSNGKPINTEHHQLHTSIERCRVSWHWKLRGSAIRANVRRTQIVKYIEGTNVTNWPQTGKLHFALYVSIKISRENSWKLWVGPLLKYINKIC